jgi:hypothetical protein
MNSYQLTTAQDDALYGEWLDDALADRSGDVDTMFGKWLQDKFKAVRVDPLPGGSNNAILYFASEEHLNWFLLKIL